MSIISSNNKLKERGRINVRYWHCNKSNLARITKIGPKSKDFNNSTSNSDFYLKHLFCPKCNQIKTQAIFMKLHWNNRNWIYIVDADGLGSRLLTWISFNQSIDK